MNIDVFNRVCRDLPEDWQIDIVLTEGCMGVDLTDPDGNLVEFCDDDLSPDQMIIKRLNYARKQDGLGPSDEQ